MNNSDLKDILKATDLIDEAFKLLGKHWDSQLSKDATYSYFFNERMTDFQEVHSNLMAMKKEVLECKEVVKPLQGYFNQCQLDFIKDNIDNPLLKLQFMHIINEETKRHSYCVQSNVYLNDDHSKAYINKHDSYSMTLTKHQFKQSQIELSKALGLQVKHIGFNNSLGYVRFVYGVKRSN